MFNIIIFVVVFVYLSQGALVRMFIKSLINPKETILPFKDKNFLKKLQKKTGIDFDIKVIKSKQFFGAMHGIPAKPIMTLSSKALEILDKGELEWVVLHEAGHCLGYHVPFLIVGFLITLMSGIYLAFHLSLGLYSIPILLLMAFIFNVIYQQIGRVTEYFADRYAVTHIDDPNNMIRANRKLRKRALRHRSVYNSEILLFLFAPHISYSNRILMAQRKIIVRKS